MRPVFCALLLLLSARVAHPSSEVTVVLQFEKPYSEQSIREMKIEAQSLITDPRVKLSWRLASELSASDAFARMIVVRLRGSCEIDQPAPPLAAQNVPLAYTYFSAGEPMPFSDIECDRIRSSLRSAPGGRSDLVFGRALGRVLAHELHHILAKTRAHTQTGCTRKSLSTVDLIADRRN
jgi:hypothetical protein